MPNDDFNINLPEYLGEVAPRRRRVAVLMTLLSPGLGYVYLGRLLVGVLSNTLFVLIFFLFVLLWIRQKFFPLWPLLIMAVGWGTLVGLIIRDSLRLIREDRPYVLQPANRLITYIAVALFTFWMPLGFTINWSNERLWGWVWSGDDTMYPTIASGDLIMVDRAAYNGRDPFHGDLVFVEPPTESGGSVFLARVIGIDGDLVQIEDGVPFVVDAPLTHYRPAPGEAPEDVTGLGPATPHQIVYEASRQKLPEGGNEPVRWYAVAMPDNDPEAYSLKRSKPVALKGGDLFLLNDNRLEPIHTTADGGGARVGRRVPREWITGRPLYILYSRSSGGAPRWDRVGLRLQ